MKKIEYAELKRMGATEKQLETYSNSDPLDIYKNENGSFNVEGAVIISEGTAQDVLDLLDVLGEE